MFLKFTWEHCDETVIIDVTMATKFYKIDSYLLNYHYGQLPL